MDSQSNPRGCRPAGKYFHLKKRKNRHSRSYLEGYLALIYLETMSECSITMGKVVCKRDKPGN